MQYCIFSLLQCSILVNLYKEFNLGILNIKYYNNMVVEKFSENFFRNILEELFREIKSGVLLALKS